MKDNKTDQAPVEAPPAKVLAEAPAQTVHFELAAPRCVAGVDLPAGVKVGSVTVNSPVTVDVLIDLLRSGGLIAHS